MKLSIVISARSEFPAIIFTVHSILNDLETFLTPKDFEIIIVNNCSDDRDPVHTALKGTTEFLSARGAYHNGIIKILYDPIAGNVSARNKGAAIAKGNYLFFSDAHMSYSFGFFKRMIETIDETDGIVHATYSWMGAYPHTREGTQYSWKLGEEFKGCVDEETEILTIEGWKRWNEVSMASKFVTVNTKTKLIEFQKPRDLVIKKYNGDMIKINGRSYNALLTPNHRCLYQSEWNHRNNRQDNWDIKLAEELKSSDYLPQFSLGYYKKKKVYSDELVELIGWIIAEGSFNKEYKFIYRGYKQLAKSHIRITQYISKNRKQIEYLLKKLKFRYCLVGKIKKDFKIYPKESEQIFKILPKKELTFKFINELTNAQLKILHATLVKADGIDSLTNKNFIQVNNTTLDAFQFLCVLIGKISRKYFKTVESYKGNHFGKKDIGIISVKDNKYTHHFKLEKIKYKGIIWCPDLKNGTIFIRRNGYVMLTGNTWNPYIAGDGKNWFYIPGCGHCILGMKRQQFLDFKGYPDWLRCYGGGEMFLDSKWWMFGKPVVCEPRAHCYHLSAGRGYSYVHDDYIHNVFHSSLVLGADMWAERTKLNYLRKNRPEVIERLWKEAEQEAQEQRKFIEEKRVMTFNDMIKDQPWDKLNDEKFGSHNSGMLIYNKTWVEELKKTPEVYELWLDSELQKSLSDFIDKNLKQFCYKEN